MKTRLVTALMAAVMVFTSPSWAEDKDEITVLDTMVVTDSVKQTTLLKTPGSVTILTAKDIRNSGQTKLADLISTIPGVINQRSSTKTYLSIRGTRSIRSSGAVIYVDGRPINTGLYNYSKIDTIPLDNVIKIEVIKSPPTSIYGANAAQGVILITTMSGQDGDKPFSGDVSMEYGSWDTKKATATVSGMDSGFSYSLTGHGFETDGYRDSDEEVKSLDGKLGYQFDWGSINLVAGFNDSFTRYPKGLDSETAARDPESPGFINGDGYFELPNQSDEEMTTLGLGFNYDKNNWLLTSSLNYTMDEQLFQQMEDQNSSDLGDREDDYADDREDERINFKINGGRTFGSPGSNLVDTFTLGFEMNHTDYDQTRSYPFALDPNDSSTWTDEADMLEDQAQADINATQKLYAFTANNDFNWGNFRLLAGGRLNYVEYDLKNRIPDAVTKDYDGDFDWNIAPSYAVIPNGNLFIAYSHSHYYLPLFHYKQNLQYDEAEAQAEDLDPEIYDAWEAGFKHRLHKAFNYSVILYRTSIDDKVIAYYTGTSTRSKGYVNAGDSIHKGIELEIDGRPLEWLGYRMGFTTIDAKWDQGSANVYSSSGSRQTVDLSGKDVYTVPEYEYALGLDLYMLRQSRYGDLTGSLDIRGFGKQPMDLNNNYDMDEGHFVDLKLTWTLGRYELYLTCTNLFDKQWDKYVNSTGKDPDTMAGGMSGIYPQDGRYIGIGGAIHF